MDYRKVYINIIKKVKLKNRFKGDGNYYEKHHILPKSLFPLWKKRKSNIVLLTAREYFFCHQLLTKIYPGREMSYALIAFMNRPNADYKITSKEYERLKLLRSKIVSEQMKGNHYGKNHSPWNKGIIMNEDQRKRLRGVKRSEQARKNISEAHKGLKYPPLSDEHKKIISEYKKTHPISSETRKKMSESHKGKTFTDTHRKKLSEKLTGLKRSKETKDKMSQKAKERNRFKNPIRCIETGEIFWYNKDIVSYAPGASHYHDVINGNRKFAGILNGIKLSWEIVL